MTEPTETPPCYGDGLTSADWLRAIRWWRDHVEDAETLGLSRDKADAAMRHMSAKARECKRREERRSSDPADAVDALEAWAHNERELFGKQP